MHSTSFRSLACHSVCVRWMLTPYVVRPFVVLVPLQGTYIRHGYASNKSSSPGHLQLTSMGRPRIESWERGCVSPGSARPSEPCYKWSMADHADLIAAVLQLASEARSTQPQLTAQEDPPSGSTETPADQQPLHTAELHNGQEEDLLIALGNEWLALRRQFILTFLRFSALPHVTDPRGMLRRFYSEEFTLPPEATEDERRWRGTVAGIEFMTRTIVGSLPNGA